MLRIAIELPPAPTGAGEFLADVRAYEAAAADAVWIGGAAAGGTGFEPLVLLAAAATVTARAGLATTLDAAGPWPAATLGRTVATLAELSRGRVLLGVEAAAGVATGKVVDVLDAAGVRVFACGAEPDWPLLARAAGIVCRAGTAEAAAAAFARARDARGGGEPAAPFELWARVPAPGGRVEWRDLLARYEAAGATGVVVSHAPNLLDILRNPEEDDRQDLAMAVG